MFDSLTLRLELLRRLLLGGRRLGPGLPRIGFFIAAFVLLFALRIPKVPDCHKLPKNWMLIAAGQPGSWAWLTCIMLIKFSMAKKLNTGFRTYKQ